MVATLAWTRLDFTMPGWAFLGGTKLVWTATIKGEERQDRINTLCAVFNFILKDMTGTVILHLLKIILATVGKYIFADCSNNWLKALDPVQIGYENCDDRLGNEKKSSQMLFCMLCIFVFKAL